MIESRFHGYWQGGSGLPIIAGHWRREGFNFNVRMCRLPEATLRNANASNHSKNLLVSTGTITAGEATLS
jgi:hypothetical protein